MEQRAVVLCFDPDTEERRQYDLLDAAYPYWTGFARITAMTLVLIGVIATMVCLLSPYIQLQGIQDRTVLVYIALGFALSGHSLYWLQHAKREAAGVQIIDYRHTENAKDDPSTVFAQVIDNSRTWYPAIWARGVMVWFSDLFLLISLCVLSLTLQSVTPMLFFLLFLPSSLMLLADYKKVKMLAHSRSQLHWITNDLGWSGVIRYHDEA